MPTTTKTGTDPAAAGNPPDCYWERRRRGAALPLAVGVLGLVALGVGQVLPLRDRVESDLTSRSEAALRDAGLPGLQVSFRGRDGSVRGTTASAPDLARAAEIVRGVEGVRVVEIRTGTFNPGGPVAVPGATRTPVVVPPSAVVSSEAVTLTASATTGATPAASTTGPAVGATPAPAVAPSSPVAVQARLAALPTITFACGSVALTPRGRVSVAQAARILAAAPGIRVAVRGYTDDIGDWHVNLGLSRARAAGVRQALIAKGVPAGSLAVAGYSEDFPRVANDSASHRAMNRRVELAVR